MQSKQSLPVRAVPENLPSDPFEYTDEIENLHTQDSILLDYCRVLYKFRTIIFATVIASTIVFTLFAFLITPRFTGKSQIRIGTYLPVLSDASVEGVFQDKSKEANYLETQIREISSYTLADRVLSREDVKQMLNTKSKEVGFFSSLFGGGEDEDGPSKSQLSSRSGYRQSVSDIKNYLSALSVTPVRRTSLVEIKFTSTSPETAAFVANKHADEYRDWVRVSRVEERANTLKFLREQSEDLREKVINLEREIADYAEEHSIVAVNSDQNITAQRMSQLNQLLTEVSAKRIEAEKIHEKGAEALSGSGAGFDDDTTRRLRSELASKQGEYSQMLEKFTPQYPAARQLAAQIEGLKQAIAEQREQIISGLDSRSQALKLEEERLSEELEKQKSQAFELAKRQVQYNVLNRELESSRELLQSVLRQTKESALAIEGNSSNISIVDYSVVPVSPSYPKKSLLVFGGFGFGLGLGIALAFLINHLDNTIRTPESLAQLTNVPNLGVVPSFEAELNSPRKRGIEEPLEIEDLPSHSSEDTSSGALTVTDTDNSSIAFLEDPRSLAAEAYRSIRTAILLSQAGEPPKTVLVTSAQSSEGKTTSVINIAASLASAGGRVLVIDCDLRRPSVLKYLGEERELPGVVEVLTGSHKVDDVILPNVVKRISLIPSGRIPPNPAELVGSMEMNALLRELEGRYDFIVVDSPPILPVTDSVVLSRFVDGVVFVVKGGTTPKRVISDAKDRLESVGARFIGTVLNDIDFHGGDYYYYNKYYLSYYRQDEEEGDEDDDSPRAASA